MKEVVLNLAITLDGYIANKNNEIEFLGDFSDQKSMQEMNFDKFVAGIDTIVVGRSAYEITNSFGPMEQQFPNKKIIVWIFGGGNMVHNF